MRPGRSRAASKEECVRTWFRRRTRAEQAPEEAAAPLTEQVVPPAGKPGPAPGAEAEAPPAAPEEGAQPRRRSGSRRRKPAADAAEQEGPQAGAAAEPAKEAERPRRERRRRTETPRRSALPPVHKQMLISIEVLEQRVAVLEDGKPVEVYLERPNHRSIAGNIYLGTVDNVLPGMEASFVDIGLEKNGFLYVDEIVVPELEGRRHGRRIQELISRGQQVLVQATKDPMGTKGARLTTEISLPGRFVVYTPFAEGIGVSRRLDDAERDRLKAICKRLDLPEGGVIVRTAAEGVSEEEIAGDIAFLQTLWKSIRARAEGAQAPSLVYREAELPLRVVRDLFLRDFERLAVDHEPTYHRIVSYLSRTSPDLAEKVEFYQDVEPLMEASGVEAAVRSTLDRRVDLPSGGYLVFDYAEAFTVIDVNTGRFVGARGKSSGARLEDTITKNNLEATKEIVRQLRLRDIGGIIVIDFIDMANPKNRQEVENALKRELERDRTKTYVVEISPLGLVEMTRQNVTDGPREILTQRCETCAGNGVVVSAESHAVQAERRMRALVHASRAPAFLVELPARVAGVLIGPAGSRLAEIERETGRMFAFELRDDVPDEHFAVLAEGTAEEVAPRALPVESGQVVTVLLEERHPQERGDAIARLGGYLIHVAGGGKRVGRRARIRVERATSTVAYASLVAAAPEPEAPVEAGTVAEEEQAEATRRRARRGGRRKAAPAREPSADGEVVPAEPEEGAAETAAEGEEAAPKKRTRRGSRGGRGRRKATAALGAEATEAEAAAVGAETDAGGEAQAPEPVAGEVEGAAEPAGEGETAVPKKRTRRGSRGGRGRRKAAAPGAEPREGGPATELRAEDVEPEAASAEPPETVEGTDEPAGEEGAPKKRPRRGSRGGRARKKPAATEEAEAPSADGAPLADDSPAGTAEPEGAAESAGDGAAAKKRTRRGTRGGRGRRRPAAAASASDEPSEPVAEPA
jgi:ribonuclease G